ncbi:MAG: hypothetical protein COB98_08200 [Flavobacteriaceae bacterium]|nr:MAG: hypothetical protein COB98_08200 [Flavobacteriaceae bacterium]
MPLVFYLFLSKGIYHYSNLPILTTDIVPVTQVDNQQSGVTFDEKLSILCFLGADVQKAEATLFNLNETIYKRYYQKPFFQIIAIVPKQNKEEMKQVLKKLSQFTDIKGWNFVYADATGIKQLFESLDSPFEMDETQFSEYAFIIDKKGRLRGRKDDEDTDGGRLYGYNMKAVAILKNKMKDDIDIIYYQWKKSAEKLKRRQRKV